MRTKGHFCQVFFLPLPSRAKFIASLQGKNNMSLFVYTVAYSIIPTILYRHKQRDVFKESRKRHILLIMNIDQLGGCRFINRPF